MCSGRTVTDTTIHMLGYLSVGNVLLVGGCCGRTCGCCEKSLHEYLLPGSHWQGDNLGNGAERKLKLTDTVRSSVPVVYSSGTAISRTRSFLPRLSRGTCLGWQTRCPFPLPLPLFSILGVHFLSYITLFPLFSLLCRSAMDIQLNYHTLWADVAGFTVIKTVLVIKYVPCFANNCSPVIEQIHSIWTNIALTVISLPELQGGAGWDIEQGSGTVNLQQGGPG